MLSKQTISSKITIVALTLLALFLGNLKFKQWRNESKIEKEKQSLERQAVSLQKKNDELNRSLQSINSLNFKERVARQQLDLKKQGEEVYSFSDAPQNQALNSQGSAGVSNAQKWWAYFFSIE